MVITTTIQVCVGSACHLKGSYHVIRAFQEQVEKFDLGKAVTVKALFCLERCGQAVSVKIDNEEESIYSISPKMVEEFFIEHILPHTK